MNTRFSKWLLVTVAAAAVGSGAARATKVGAQPTLVDIVRDAAGRFRDVGRAIDEGYAVMPSCVSGPEEGAMGVHYVNGTLFGDGQLDARTPEALVYEPTKEGRLRLVAVEYIVPAEAWHANHEGPPVLEGQHFHFVGSPNRYGAAAFYELHVWAWRPNPRGTFADWNPNVSCDNYAGSQAAATHH